MTVSSRSIASSLAAAFILSSAISAFAQTRAEPAEAGSLAALTAEIRQLRIAVEEATRTQTQTQALGVYLSAQQSRLVQVAARADGARKELDAVTLRSNELAGRLAELAEAVPQISDPTKRAELDDHVRGLKREQANIAAERQQIQNRDDELSQMLQVENARWTDLISRLEQLLKK